MIHTLKQPQDWPPKCYQKRRRFLLIKNQDSMSNFRKKRHQIQLPGGLKMMTKGYKYLLSCSKNGLKGEDESIHHRHLSSDLLGVSSINTEQKKTKPDEKHPNTDSYRFFPKV